MQTLLRGHPEPRCNPAAAAAAAAAVTAQQRGVDISNFYYVLINMHELKPASSIRQDDDHDYGPS